MDQARFLQHAERMTCGQRSNLQIKKDVFIIIIHLPNSSLMEVGIERGEINTERKPKRNKPSSYHLSLNSQSAFTSDKTDLPSSKSFHQGDICIQLTIQHKWRIIISSVAWQWNCITKSPALASHFLFQALLEVLSFCWTVIFHCMTKWNIVWKFAYCLSAWDTEPTVSQSWVGGGLEHFLLNYFLPAPVALKKKIFRNSEFYISKK